MSLKVYCTTAFRGFHRWADAPSEVNYLASVHRHTFHVRAEFAVRHGGRHIEFITKQAEIDKAIASLRVEPDVLLWSCEMWAEAIGIAVGADSVEVSEDGENGAVWTKEE